MSGKFTMPKMRSMYGFKTVSFQDRETDIHVLELQYRGPTRFMKK